MRLLKPLSTIKLVATVMVVSLLPWLNHWEGGLGFQPAVELACVVGHFGSKTAQPANMRKNKNPTHPHLRSLMIGFTESLSSGTNAGVEAKSYGARFDRSGLESKP